MIGIYQYIITINKMNDLMLNKHIVCTIFSFLHLNDLFSCVQVCKRWHDVFNMDILWSWKSKTNIENIKSMIECNEKDIFKSLWSFELNRISTLHSGYSSCFLFPLPFLFWRRESMLTIELHSRNRIIHHDKKKINLKRRFACDENKQLAFRAKHIKQISCEINNKINNKNLCEIKSKPVYNINKKRLNKINNKTTYKHKSQFYDTKTKNKNYKYMRNQR